MLVKKWYLLFPSFIPRNNREKINTLLLSSYILLNKEHPKLDPFSSIKINFIDLSLLVFLDREILLNNSSLYRLLDILTKTNDEEYSLNFLRSLDDYVRSEIGRGKWDIDILTTILQNILKCKDVSINKIISPPLESCNSRTDLQDSSKYCDSSKFQYCKLCGIDVKGQQYSKYKDRCKRCESNFLVCYFNVGCNILNSFGQIDLQIIEDNANRVGVIASRISSKLFCTSCGKIHPFNN